MSEATTVEHRRVNTIDRLLRLMQERGASDLHLVVGRHPAFRLRGQIEPLRYRILTEPELARMMQPIAPAASWKQFVETGDADFAYEIPQVARFRVNVFRQERGMGAVFRLIPSRIMSLDQLGVPPSVRQVTRFRSGLVLVTGPTGSGKSTTLAGMIDEINSTRPMHIITIEDPIEFVHPTRKCVFSQREIGAHSNSFAEALRAATREDPNAILVGEMRDLETIEMALSAAATGVLVMGTLHTNSASKAIDRMINVFPSDRQAAVRGMVASALVAVVAQQLLPRKGGGRAAAHEVLIATPAMASAIRDGKTHQLSGMLKMGKRQGMIAMDDSLKALIAEEAVEPLDALEKALDKDSFRKWMREEGHRLPDDVGDA